MSRLVRGKAGQYTWLQLLSLVIATIAFAIGSQTVAIVMLILGFIFGAVSTYIRYQEAKGQMRQQSNRNRGRR